MTARSDIFRTLDGRGKSLDSTRWSYKLAENSYGMDVAYADNLQINEKEMSAWIPIADGNARDGQGDVLLVTGIDTSRLATTTFPFTTMTEGLLNRSRLEAIPQGIGIDIQFSRPVLQNLGSALVGDESGSGVLLPSTVIRAYDRSIFGLSTLVRPPVEYVVDRGVTDPKIPGDLGCALSFSVHIVDLHNIRIGEFGFVGLLAFGQSSVPSTIFVILLGGSPEEVVQSVVVAGAVQMPALHALRTGSEECLQNQPMDKCGDSSRSAAGQIAVIHVVQFQDCVWDNSEASNSLADGSLYGSNPTHVGYKADLAFRVFVPYLLIPQQRFQTLLVSGPEIDDHIYSVVLRASTYCKRHSTGSCYDNLDQSEKFLWN